MNRSNDDRAVAVWYEHPEWFRPLFAELDRRGIPYARLHAARHRYDPGEAPPPWALVLNRMSPSAHLRGHAPAIFHTTHWLAHLERHGVRVVNGSPAWRAEISKATQLSILADLGLPFPRARVIDAAEEASAAAEGLRFPVVVKPNVGGSGAGIVRFEGPGELAGAARRGELDLGLDGTGLVQEFAPPMDGRIVRVEVLGGELLYAIRVDATGGDFNLCPADLCGPDGSGSQGPRVEAYDPPPDVVDQVLRITAAAGIEVGGVEYLVDARDARTLFYDVNALSNFVADAPRVVGFDPFARLAEWMEREIGREPGFPTALRRIRGTRDERVEPGGSSTRAG